MADKPLFQLCDLNPFCSINLPHSWQDFACAYSAKRCMQQVHMLVPVMMHVLLLCAVAHSMQDDQVLQRKNLPERIMRVLSRQEPSNTGESGQTQP